MRMLAASGGDHFLALVAGAEVCSVALDDSVAQLGGSTNRCVLGEIPLDSSNGRIFDVPRRLEMRLSCAKVDEVGAALF